MARGTGRRALVVMEEHALLLRTLRFLGGLAGSPIPAKWFDEYQALSIDLVEYLSPYNLNGELEEETTNGAAG